MDSDGCIDTQGRQSKLFLAEAVTIYNLFKGIERMPHLVFAKLELTMWRDMAAWVDMSAFRNTLEGGNGLDIRGRNRYVV